MHATYAMVTPVAQMTGMSANACARLLLSVSSPIADFATPVFPLRRPQSERARTRVKKERERPRRSMEMVMPARPESRTGLRPI
jgi:hypothetical protein